MAQEKPISFLFFACFRGPYHPRATFRGMWEKWEARVCFCMTDLKRQEKSKRLSLWIQEPERTSINFDYFMQPAIPLSLRKNEPELGLHPFAIEVIAQLIRSASTQVQVIVATQSVSLIDRFEPKHVVVVDRAGGESHFRRLSEGDLKEWLSEYSISELWEKNVLGGRPAL